MHSKVYKSILLSGALIMSCGLTTLNAKDKVAQKVDIRLDVTKASKGALNLTKDLKKKTNSFDIKSLKSSLFNKNAIKTIKANQKAEYKEGEVLVLFKTNILPGELDTLMNTKGYSVKKVYKNISNQTNKTFAIISGKKSVKI